MSTENMPTPAKKYPRSHHHFVTYLYRLADCLTDNASVPNPDPSVAEIRACAGALAGVFAAYLNPHRVVDLANRLLACF